MRLLVLLVAVVLLAADGPFAGKWTSTRSESQGNITITLKPEPAVMFTLNGEEVKTVVSDAKISDDGFEMDWDFTLSGYKLRSTARATVRGDKLAGEYRTRVLDEGATIDEGKFEGSLKQP